MTTRHYDGFLFYADGTQKPLEVSAPDTIDINEVLALIVKDHGADRATVTERPE